MPPRVAPATTPRVAAGTTQRVAQGMTPRVSPATPPRIASAYLAILVVVAVLAIIAGHQAGQAYQSARADGAYPPEMRRIIIFGALFNCAALVILVVAWLIEMFAAAISFVRLPAARARVLVRLAVALIPLAAFGLGHLVANPWALGLLAQLRAAIRPG